MRLNLNLDRSYDSLKLFRTYIGGSKKKELRTFWDAQGYAKDEIQGRLTPSQMLSLRAKRSNLETGNLLKSKQIASSLRSSQRL